MSPARAALALGEEIDVVSAGRTVRTIAALGIPISVVCGLLLIGGVVGLVASIVLGDLYRFVLSLLWIAAFASLGYEVAVVLRRNIRAWDQTLQSQDTMKPRTTE